MELDNKLIQLSDKLLRYIRNRLYFQYRFLEPALYRLLLTPFCILPEGYGTNGERLFYDAEAFVRRYRNDSAREMRRFLHSVFHCIYLHPFMTQTVDNDIWSIACDITVEASIIMELGEFALPEDQKRKEIIQNIQKEVTLLTTHEIIDYLRKHTELHELFRKLFAFDNHLWLHTVERKKPVSEKNKEDDKPDKKLNNAKEHDEDNQHDDKPGNRKADDEDNERKKARGGKDSDKNKNDSDADESRETDSSVGCDSCNGSDDGSESETEGNGDGGGDGMGNGEQDAQSYLPDTKAKAEEWKEASRIISSDLKNFCQHGTARGLISQNIDYLTRDEMDYETFLEQFAIIEEVVKIDPDEFDYMYYTYGLSLPGPKKLLIEPLEYREEKRIRTFVIAIDTSGSCAGGLVKKFLNKTYSILKSTESFSSKVDIHIIQCDAAIQEHIQIHKLEDIEQYAKNFKVKGRGGTDFRPVFEYVEKLIGRHVIQELNGLIYFTDGYGTYPQKPTDYKTAFVYLDNYDERLVPPWAMRVYWKE